jgi:hypothetical protein
MSLIRVRPQAADRRFESTSRRAEELTNQV